jgi:hypothetical protein
MNDMTRFEQRVDDWLNSKAPLRAPNQILTELAERTAEASQERVLRGPLGRPVVSRDALPQRRRFGTFAAGIAAGVVIALLGLAGLRWLPAVIVPAATPTPSATAPSAVIDPAATPTPSATAPPTSGAHLIYVLNGDLYVANADGSDTRFIAGDDPSDACGGARFDEGFVSPNGQYLAYRSGLGQNCSETITISDLNGNELATFPGEGWVIGWAPDSTRLVTWLDFGYKVAVYGVDGARQAVLDGSLMCCGDYDPIWSPDGAESILIWARGTVWDIPIDGTEPRHLPANDPRSKAGNGGFGVWYSPDRSRAVFVAGGGGTPVDGTYWATGDLVIANADGSNGRVLIADTLATYFDSIVWSPSGDRIAFALLDEPNFFGEEPTSSELHVVDVGSGAVHTVKAPASGSARPRSFSADESSVLFESHGLWAVNVDGTGERLVLEGAADGAWITTRVDGV